MLEQSVVLVFLQASITGAGLVLAIYALIIPFSKRLFESSLKDFLQILNSSKESLNKLLSGKFNSLMIEKTQRNMTRWFESWSFPSYIRFGIGATFCGYTITALLSIFYAIGWNQPVMDQVIPVLFIASTLFFLVVGLISIKDIHNIMRKDYYELIKTLKENENNTA